VALRKLILFILFILSQGLPIADCRLNRKSAACGLRHRSQRLVTSSAASRITGQVTADIGRVNNAKSM
jgi:hypothetical protein